MNILVELFWRFLIVSLFAFGGGAAALSLVERATVADTGWITAEQFGAAVSFGYITPGPILILATFVGYQVAALPGALSATAGVFILPWLLATAAAVQFRRYVEHRRFRGFGTGAAP